METKRPWVTVGLVVAALGAFGVLLAVVLWPIPDARPLKMSCYWAMRVALLLHFGLGLLGLLLALADERPAAAALSRAVIAVALLMPLALHLVVPVMPHSLPHAYAHDLLALVAAAAAGATLATARGETDIDAALDALEAGAQQPGA